MRWKQIEDEPKTFVLVFKTGDEIASLLQQFSKEQALGGSSFKAIGALSYAKLSWFNWETKKYEPACVLDEQVELLSLIGDVALKDGEPQVHAHAVVGRRDGIAVHRLLQRSASESGRLCCGGQGLGARRTPPESASVGYSLARTVHTEPSFPLGA